MGNGTSCKCCTDLFVTPREKQRSASRSLHSNCRHLGVGNLSMSVISGLPLTMDDLLSPPFDGTTSTPCMSTASSFVTTSSYCDDIFKLDPFSEPLENEARVVQQTTTTSTSGDNRHRKVSAIVDDADRLWSLTSFGAPPHGACSTFCEDSVVDAAADSAWTSTTATVDWRDLAFVMTESSDSMAAASVPSTADDTTDAGLAQRGDSDGKERTNGQDSAAAATSTWNHGNNDNDDDNANVLEAKEKPEVVVDIAGEISRKNEETTANGCEDGGGLVAVTEGTTSPGSGNSYAATDVIDELMAAEFPETTAPQADSEEVVLLSPTPPTLPPPPPPPSEEDGEPEVDKQEVATYDEERVDRKPEEDGEHAAAGHHEPRVTFSGPLQFMGRNDLPRDDATPPLSPVSSPVKLLDVLPATLKDAAAAEASLGRSVPMTSGSIDAVSLDEAPSPWSGTETSRIDDQPDVFREPPSTPPPRMTPEDSGEAEARQTAATSPDAAESTESQTSVDVTHLVATETTQTVNGFPDELSMEEQINDASSVEPTSDIQPRDSDSLTNYFEYPDASTSCVAEKHEEPMNDDGATLRTGGDDAPASFSVTADAGPQNIAKESDAISENSDERKLTEEEHLSHEDGSRLQESPEAEQHETNEKEDDRRTSDTHMHMHDHGDLLLSEEVVANVALVAESPALNAAVLLSFEPKEIAHVQNESGPVSPPGCQLMGTVEPQQPDEVGVSEKTAELSGVETHPELEMQESETASIVVQPSSPTTAPDAAGKIDNDVQLVSADGLVVDVDVSESAANVELRVTDQPDEDLAEAERYEAKQNEEKTCESEFSLHGDLYSLEISESGALSNGTLSESDLPSAMFSALTESSEVVDSVEKAPSPAVTAGDGHAAALASVSVEQPAVGEDKSESPVDVAATAAAGNEDDAGEMAFRNPVTQSVLSARDVFIEQQTSAAAIMENVCIVCGKRAYEMEKIIADQAVYHKTCFRCSHCNRVLSLANFACMEGHIYCKPHFMEIFMTKGTYDDSFAVAKEMDIAQYYYGDYGDRRPLTSADTDAVMIVPLETVRGVYEKLSREAVEAQLTRPLPGRRFLQEHSDLVVTKNGYHGDADTESRDVMPEATDDDVSAGKKSVLERSAAGMHGGRATSAPTTPVHRPPTTGTDRDVSVDELPQHGLTQALVAQWRELEQRARAEMRLGAARSRSLSGLALRRSGLSPSPSRHAEQGRSDDDEDSSVEELNVAEQGRSRQQTSDGGQRRGDVADGDEEPQLPPPLMTQHMLAKFRDMEAETHTSAAPRRAMQKKAFKWEVKQVLPLVRGLTGAGDVPRSSGVDTTAGDAAAINGTVDRSMSASVTAEKTTSGEDELPEPGTTRNLLAKFQSLQTTTQ